MEGYTSTIIPGLLVRNGFKYVCTFEAPIISIKRKGWFLECETADGKKHRIDKNGKNIIVK